MDPIEKAIRGALEKGNPLDPEFRLRIFASAEHALVRSFAAKPDMDIAEQHARVQQLRSITASIEREFAPAVAPDIAPQKRPVAAPAPQRTQPKPTRPVAPAVSTADEKAARQEERRRRAKAFNRLAGVFVLLTLLAMAVMLGWSVWTSDLLSSQRGQQELADNATSQDDDAENWVTVFMPNDSASVELGEGVTAGQQGSGKDAFLQILATGKGGVATFEVSRDVLESLQGKKVVFDVRAKTDDGANVEVALGCDLAGMGQCQRTRFHLDAQVTDNLLIVQLADTGPEANGSLTLTPDLSATGKPVNVESIRVRIEP